MKQQNTTHKIDAQSDPIYQVNLYMKERIAFPKLKTIIYDEIRLIIEHYILFRKVLAPFLQFGTVELSASPYFLTQEKLKAERSKRFKRCMIQCKALRSHHTYRLDLHSSF